MHTTEPHLRQVTPRLGRVGGRRQFLGQLVTAAATIVLDPGRVTAVPEGSPAAAPLPSIQFGKHRITRLVTGSNPILGYSYLGIHTDRQMKEYFTVDRTVDLLERCERAGITAHQFGGVRR